MRIVLVGLGAVGTLVAHALKENVIFYLDTRSRGVEKDPILIRKLSYQNYQATIELSPYEGEEFQLLIICLKYGRGFQETLKLIETRLPKDGKYRILLLQNGFKHIQIAREVWGRERVDFGVVESFSGTLIKGAIHATGDKLPLVRLEDGYFNANFVESNRNSTIATFELGTNVISGKLPRWLVYSAFCSALKLKLFDIPLHDYSLTIKLFIDEINDCLHEELNCLYSYDAFLNEIALLESSFKPSSLIDIERSHTPEIHWVLYDLLVMGQTKGLSMKITRELLMRLPKAQID